jgi:two-component system cell cycle response regulator/two-component system cell cycle response regulator DivK
VPTVLLVEDHPMNRKLFRDLLGIRFEVLEAGSAEEARAELNRATPDLIVLDIQLPGVDGLTFLRELRSDSRYAAVPVAAVSARAMPADVQAARDAGCDLYITKPVTDDPAVFLDRLSTLIGRSA